MRAVHAIVFLAGALGLGAVDAAAQTRASEYDVKATYLYKFAPFVDWPTTVFAAEAAPLNVCIVGKDPFGSDLDKAVVGQALNSHPVQVRRIPRIDARSGCHIAFLGGSREQPAADALKLLAGEPVLTVTDEVSGPAAGTIHFVVRERRIRFLIDSGAATRSGLQLSSKLLSLAVAVKP